MSASAKTLNMRLAYKLNFLKLWLFPSDVK
jgi:hypothetical protein